MAGRRARASLTVFFCPAQLRLSGRFSSTPRCGSTKPLGYLGAYLEDGFGDPLLCRIATELRERMPMALGAHPLQQMWAYKHEQGMYGINPHADFAAVNVNFWITDNAANLTRVPGAWSSTPNPHPRPGPSPSTITPARGIYGFLGDAKDQAMRVPHRTKRAVCSISAVSRDRRDRFAPGYENRRINITMLYGSGP